MQKKVIGAQGASHRCGSDGLGLGTT